LGTGSGRFACRGIDEIEGEPLRVSSHHGAFHFLREEILELCEGDGVRRFAELLLQEPTVDFDPAQLVLLDHEGELLQEAGEDLLGCPGVGELHGEREHAQLQVAAGSESSPEESLGLSDIGLGFLRIEAPHLPVRVPFVGEQQRQDILPPHQPVHESVTPEERLEAVPVGPPTLKPRLPAISAPKPPSAERAAVAAPALFCPGGAITA
jgi:hypothetical protein